DLTVAGGAVFDQAGFSQSLRSIAGAGSITNSGAATTLTVNGSSATTFSGKLTGPLGLTKAGTGTLSLTNAGNTYNRPTLVNGGVLNFVSGALSTGTITFGGGTLQFAGGNAQDVSARIAGSGGTISIDTNGNAIAF